MKSLMVSHTPIKYESGKFIQINGHYPVNFEDRVPGRVENLPYRESVPVKGSQMPARVAMLWQDSTRLNGQASGYP
jgi:hypothetical protein